MPRVEGSFEAHYRNIEDRRLRRRRSHVQRNEPNGGRIRGGQKKLMGARRRGFLVMAGRGLFEGIAAFERAGQHALGVAEDQH
jgi:hypothetical protein